MSLNVGKFVLILSLVCCLAASAIPAQKFQIIRNVDGDSFVARNVECREANLDDCNQSIRLIGVNTPEIAQEKWGKLAAAFTSEFFAQNPEFWLETDIRPKDQYGRTLAYVYSSDKSQMLNKELLENGFAEVYTFARNRRYLTDFKILEASARKSNKNIWHKEEGLKLSPSKFRSNSKREKDNK